MRHRLSYLGLRLVGDLFALLPLRVAQRMGELAGRVCVPLLGERRRMVDRHMRRLGISAPDLGVATRRVFAGYGRYWAEALWVRPRRRPQIERRLDGVGLDRVAEAVSAGRGMIFALPHVGNWEFAGPLGERLGFELVAVAENLSNPFLRDWFTRLRKAMGIEVVLATGRVMPDLEAAIARQAAVALLCDRDLNGRGVPVRFFGEKTTLPAGPVALALKTGAPLFPVAAYFTDDGGHQVVVHPALDLPDTGRRADDLVAGTQRLAEALEELIARQPEQWHLLQPNWPSDRR